MRGVFILFIEVNDMIGREAQSLFETLGFSRKIQEHDLVEVE